MGQYSKGMKQRVKLGQGLLHRPDLLVLDEPMNGLDPMGRQEMARILQDLAAAGVSILISSHILAELESLCKNILLLNWGRVLASGSQKEIRADIKNWSEELEIECDAPQKPRPPSLRRRRAGRVRSGRRDRPLRIRVSDAASFYEQWTGLLLDSGVSHPRHPQPQPFAAETSTTRSRHEPRPSFPSRPTVASRLLRRPARRLAADLDPVELAPSGWPGRRAAGPARPGPPHHLLACGVGHAGNSIFRQHRRPGLSLAPGAWPGSISPSTTSGPNSKASSPPNTPRLKRLQEAARRKPRVPV